MPTNLSSIIFGNGSQKIVDVTSGNLLEGDDQISGLFNTGFVDTGNGSEFLLGRVNGTAAGSGTNSAAGIDLDNYLRTGRGSDVLLGGTEFSFDNSYEAAGIYSDNSIFTGNGADGILGYSVALATDLEDGAAEADIYGVLSEDYISTGSGADVIAGAALLLSPSGDLVYGSVAGVELDRVNTGKGNDLIFGAAISGVVGAEFEPEPDGETANILEPGGGGTTLYSVGTRIDDYASLDEGDDTVIGLSLAYGDDQTNVRSTGVAVVEGDLYTGDGDDVILGHSDATGGGGHFGGSAAAGIAETLPFAPEPTISSTGLRVAFGEVNTGGGRDQVVGIGTSNIEDLPFGSPSDQAIGIDLIEARIKTGGSADVIVGVGAGAGYGVGISMSGEDLFTTQLEVFEPPSSTLDTGVGDDVVVALGVGTVGYGIAGGEVDLGSGDDLLIAGGLSPEDGYSLFGTTINGAKGDDIIYLSGGGYGEIRGGGGDDTLILTISEEDAEITATEDGDGIIISGDDFEFVVYGVETIVYDAPNIGEFLENPATLEFVFGEPLNLGDIGLEDTGILEVLEPVEDHFGALPFDPTDFSIQGLLQAVYLDGVI